MKKITFFLTTAILTAAYYTTANADSYKYTPYAGIDYIHSRAAAKGFSPYYNAAAIRIGSEYSPYFSTELFATQSNSDKRSSSHGAIKTSHRSYGLDILAYLPLGCDHRFSLFATTGIGEYVFKIRELPQKHHNEHGFGYRFGGGFKYAFDAHWQLRFAARYIKFDHVHQFNHSSEYSTGLEYHF